MLCPKGAEQKPPPGNRFRAKNLILEENQCFQVAGVEKEAPKGGLPTICLVNKPKFEGNQFSEDYR